MKLEPQVFNVLVYLLQHRDRVVPKEELLAQLWPGRFVGETILPSQRPTEGRAIGDRGWERRLIQTVHGRGDRFMDPLAERGMTISVTLPMLKSSPWGADGTAGEAVLRERRVLRSPLGG